MKKIILFATSPQDAMQWCDQNEIDFDEIIWFLSPDFMGNQLEGVECDYLCTPSFLISDQYPAAHELLKG